MIAMTNFILSEHAVYAFQTFIRVVEIKDSFVRMNH